MKKLFSIGEVAKIKDITIKTLRYYHKVGILIPSYIDDTTGYRYYLLEQFIHIDIIKGCRELGTSIDELQRIFKKAKTENLIEFLNLKKKEALKNISKMNEIIKTIDDINENVKYSKEILEEKKIKIKHFKKRYLATVQCDNIEGLNELMYYSKLDKLIRDNNLSKTIESGVLTFINNKDNIKKCFVFYILDGVIDKNLDFIKIMPEGNYITLSYIKEEENERLESLRKYIEKNKLSVNSFIELNLINDIFNTSSYSCQVQCYIE